MLEPQETTGNAKRRGRSRPGPPEQAAPASSAPETAPGDATADTGTRSQTAGCRQLKDVIARLDAAGLQLELVSPGLANNIRHIVQQSENPGQADQPAFRTRVAYALLDTEKLSGPLALAPSIREELTRLATNVPGLQNDRARDLLNATTTIADARLASDIRAAAADIARQPQQNTPDIESRLNVLENRARLAGRVPSADAGSPAGGNPATSPAAAELPPASSPGGAAQVRPPESASSLRPPPPQHDTRQPDREAAQIVVQSPGANAILTIMAAFRRPEPATPLPWDGPPALLAERHDRFEQQIMDPRRGDQSLRAAERAGQAALDALRGFGAGPGAEILTKIQDAAKATPGGLAAVLSEMRDGGRFAELRQEFNSALVTEQGFSASYDRAVAGLAQYGAQRTAIEPLLAGKANAANLIGKFEKLDAEIGQTASAIPGRADGKSALDELAAKTREIIAGAVDTVRNAFGRSADATAAPSPSPGAGP
jgi:hypothetical protein